MKISFVNDQLHLGVDSLPNAPSQSEKIHEKNVKSDDHDFCQSVIKGGGTPPHTTVEIFVKKRQMQSICFLSLSSKSSWTAFPTIFETISSGGLKRDQHLRGGI